MTSYMYKINEQNKEKQLEEINHNSVTIPIAEHGSNGYCDIK